MTKRKPKIVALSLMASMVLAGGGVAVANAADSTDTDTGILTAPTRETPVDSRAEALANALGVSTSELKTAKAQVREQAVRRRADREKAAADAKGMTLQQLRDRRADRVADRLVKAVANKRLTQTAADAVVAGVREGHPAKAQLRELRREKRADRRQDRRDKRSERRAGRS